MVLNSKTFSIGIVIDIEIIGTGIVKSIVGIVGTTTHYLLFCDRKKDGHISLKLLGGALNSRKSAGQRSGSGQLLRGPKKPG